MDKGGHARANHPEDPTGVAHRARAERLELQRRGLTRARQHDALLARAAQQLTEGGRLLRTRPARVLLLQAEHPRRELLAGELARRGIDVVGLLADPELGVQLATAVQPELVVVEDGLPGPGAASVLGSVRQACRHAHLVAMVDGPSQVSAVLAAGALRTYPRGLPAAQVARDLTALVRAR